MPSKVKFTDPKEAESKPIRLVCIADAHSFHRNLDLPAGDILIHAGHFDGRTIEAIDDFNAWLCTLPFRYKLVIAGNHDLFFYRNSKLARAHLTHATYLQDSRIVVEGLKFWGSPVHSIVGEQWVFGRERGAAIRKHWDRVPDDTDVLITHEAPYGTLDKPHILAKHAGCQHLLSALLRVKPKLHVFGHICHTRSGIGMGHDIGQLRRGQQPLPSRLFPHCRCTDAMTAMLIAGTLGAIYF